MLLTARLLGQTPLDKGIYRGQKFPFLECYLIIKDNASTIEVFNVKSRIYFGYIPTRQLTPVNNPKNKNLLLAYKGDSVQVIKDKKGIKVKLKGITTLKMQYTNLNDSTISRNINNYLSHRCYQDTRDLVKLRQNFNDSIYNATYHSYGFKDKFNLNTSDFKKLCLDFETETKIKWPN